MATTRAIRSTVKSARLGPRRGRRFAAVRPCQSHEPALRFLHAMFHANGTIELRRRAPKLPRLFQLPSVRLENGHRPQGICEIQHRRRSLVPIKTERLLIAPFRHSRFSSMPRHIAKVPHRMSKLHRIPTLPRHRHRLLIDRRPRRSIVLHMPKLPKRNRKLPLRIEIATDRHRLLKLPPHSHQDQPDLPFASPRRLKRLVSPPPGPLNQRQRILNRLPRHRQAPISKVSTASSPPPHSATAPTEPPINPAAPPSEGRRQANNDAPARRAAPRKRLSLVANVPARRRASSR